MPVAQKNASGEFDDNHQAKRLWMSDPNFTAQKLDNLQKKLNRIKKRGVLC